MSFSSRNDSIQYYVHNHTKDTINAVSVNVNWFHMSDYLIFWPEDLSVGLNIETVEGNYTGSNYIFKFQSIQTMSFDFDILPGDSQRFATAVNYRDIEEKKKLGESGMYDKPISTEISELTKFWKAEDYHQDFERLNPNQSYVRAVSVPRLNRFKSKFPELLKEKH